MLRPSIFRAVLLLSICLATSALAADAKPVPHNQSQPPGPALTPAEAVAKMTVPEGFSVEVVASEPDIVNPVAMTFDERGRVWITESLEYPRREAGPGRDRVKILEDTDGDGRADKFTVFADGLNIPSGIAVGGGGVWVANAPDLLFLQDTDGDGRADKQEVVLTGFGRSDTHELPNSLTWGPDGWLYGINGVFNYSHIKYRGREYRFTCALFRIHPETRDFELFCEGTSNPWGVAFDNEGSAFISACVIDHLWHLTETGYYHRQGGPYPPFTWKIESIVKHKHQKAAYCGIHYFDSDAYPPAYREKLYMGNIHGNCLNCDVVERKGSTYFGKPDPDFLSANDAWFMPVVQKTGPDGCLYVLDWYDQYHCYQDANRDPAGIDRLKGRLYRVRYKNTPRAGSFDLAAESDERLIERLHSPNVYFRDIAQRLLRERKHPQTLVTLQSLVLDNSQPHKARMHALWALVGSGPLDADFHRHLLSHADSVLRAWGVRAAGNMHAHESAERLGQAVAALVHDPAPDVRLQVAIAAPKIVRSNAVGVLVEVAAASGDDLLIPQIVWQNLHPLLEAHPTEFVSAARRHLAGKHAAQASILPRAMERLLALEPFNPNPPAELLQMLLSGATENHEVAAQCLALLAKKFQTRELAAAQQKALEPKLEPLLNVHLAGPVESPLWVDAAMLSASLGHSAGLSAVRGILSSPQQPDTRRLQALDALVASGGAGVLEAVTPILATRTASLDLRRRVLDSLGRLENPRVANVVLDAYPTMEAELQPQAIELLTDRAGWSKELLTAISAKRIPATALNVNQVRKLQTSKDPELAKQVTAAWGSVRTERNPAREQVIGQMRVFLRQTSGDPHAGQTVFNKLCGQCHKIHGQGQEVGPDITVNGRSSFEQLLSNVFDPSLVIGASYQARTVLTSDGRTLTGLLAEDSPQRVVLKVQGGKLETIARGDVDEMDVSKLSLMPEGVEKQLQPQEIADLFAFLTLDKPPSDPTAKQLPGVREPVARETTDRALFNELLAEVAPGFTMSASGERGVAMLAKHFGRPWVVRTHPLDRETPCVLRSTVTVPVGKRTRLALAVAHDSRGDWQLVVKANGRKLHDSIIGPKTTTGGWAELSIDLTPLAGQTVDLEILNQANGWAYEFGYWGRVEVISE